MDQILNRRSNSDITIDDIDDMNDMYIYLLLINKHIINYIFYYLLFYNHPIILIIDY